MEHHRRRVSVIASLGLLAIFGLLVASCTGTGFTHVVGADTAYYRDGPQQARPADGTLVAGTKVRLVSESGSYSLVETPDRLRVYVASDSLKALKQ